METKRIQVCHGKSCSERFASYIFKRLESDKKHHGYPEYVTIETCLCQGRCRDAPTVIFDGEVQTRQNPVTASEILRKKIATWHQSRK